MIDVSELFEYWVDYPPIHIILAAVHLPERKPTGFTFSPDAETVAKQGMQLQEFFGAGSPPSEEFKREMEWFDEKLKGINKTT